MYDRATTVYTELERYTLSPPYLRPGSPIQLDSPDILRQMHETAIRMCLSAGSEAELHQAQVTRRWIGRVEELIRAQTPYQIAIIEQRMRDRVSS